MDVFFERRVSTDFFAKVVSEQLPPGIQILGIKEFWPKLPSLQSLVRFAEYRVEVEAGGQRLDVETTLHHLLSLESLPWQHQRDTGPRHYDLRPLVDDLWLIDWRSGCAAIGMRLRCSSEGSGRPEQVAAALGFTTHPLSMHRTRLILETR